MPKANDLKIFSDLLTQPVLVEQQQQGLPVDHHDVSWQEAVVGDAQVQPSVKNPNYFLFMLGTDTVYTPLPTKSLEKEADRKSYENGETLSYMAQVVATKLGELRPEIRTDQPLSFSTPSVDVINGPTTLGTEVGERIAQGLFLILRAVADGKENIVIPAHSRGAVETILMLHELERVKKELKEHPKKPLSQILLNSPCTYTKAAVKKLFPIDAKETEEVRASLTLRLATAKVNAFLMDPVPGGRYLLIPGIAWRDERFYPKPPCNAAELLIFRDERSRCFKPVIPNGLTPIVTPGHHGTASGNVYTQQMQPVDVAGDDKDTSTVQQLVIGKLLQFINKHTGLFDTPTDAMDLKHPLLDALTNSFTSKGKSERSKLVLDLYQSVHKNDAAYKALSKGGYAYLGTELSKAGTRLVHYGAQNSMGLDTVITNLEGQFVNAEHASLFLHEQMEFSLDADKDELDTLTSKFSIVLRKLFQGFKDDNVKIKALLDVSQRKVTFQALLVFVDSISQKYLRNHLPEETKTNLLREIDTIFQIVQNFKTGTAADPINGIIAECDEMLRSGIQKTANAHYSALVDQTVKIDKQSEYFLAPKEEFASVFARFLKAMHAKLSEESEVKRLLQPIYDKLSAIRAVTVNSVGNALQDAIEALTLSENKQAMEAFTTLVFDKDLALDRYLNADIPNQDAFFTELNRVYDNLVSLTLGYVHVQTLVGKEKLEFTPKKLTMHQEVVIKLAAQILFKKKIDLHNKPESMSAEFFKKVKAQAIALGADNPDIVDLQKQLFKSHEQREFAVITLQRSEKEYHSALEKLQQTLDAKLEKEKEAHGSEKAQLARDIKGLHDDIASLKHASAAKIRDLEIELATTKRTIEELQTKWRQLDATSKQTIRELQETANTAAREYREELARQQESASRALGEETQRLATEQEQLKAQLEEQLRLAQGEHQHDKEQAGEAINTLQIQLRQLDETSKQTIRELQETANTAAREYRDELARQQESASRALSEETQRLTTEQEQLKAQLEEQLRLAYGEHQHDKEQAGEAINTLQIQLRQLEETSKQTIGQLQETANTAAREYRDELARQQESASRALNEETQRLTTEQKQLKAQLEEQLRLAQGEHQHDKEQASEAISTLQLKLQQLEETSKQTIDELQEEVTAINADAKLQRKKLQDEQQKQAKLIADLQTEKERTCFNVIAEQLLPLTQKYAAYLEREALRLNPSFTPANYKDSASFTGLPAAQEMYTKLIAKYAMVHNLLIDLTDKDTRLLPSERITHFTKSLKNADAGLKQHRDAEWIKYFNASVVALVVCTGILPGLLVLLTYAAVKGNPFRLFTQSKGEQFVNKIDYSLSDLHKGKSIGFFAQVNNGLTEDELPASSNTTPQVA